MKLGNVVDHLADLYRKAKDEPTVRKPLSFALYHTWRWCEKREKERVRDEQD